VAKGGDKKMIDRKKALFCGIDTHKDFHQAVVLDCFEEEKASFIINNNAKDIHSFIEELMALKKKKQLAIGIEGSFSYGNLLAEIMVKKSDYVYEINSIYTKEKRFCSTNWTKSDYRDAMLLASILIRKFQDLPRMSKEHTHNIKFKRLKRLLYFWDDLTLQLNRSKNQLHHLLYQQNVEYKEKYSDLNGKKVLSRIIHSTAQKKGIIADHIVFKAKRVRELKKKKKEMKKQIEKELAQLPYQLETVPGIGTVSALTILATTHGGKKIDTVNQFKSYIGCIPERNSSGKSNNSKASKMSQKRLYKAMYQVALTQLRIHKPAQDYYEKKLSEGKTKKQAMRALINRMSTIIYGVLKSKEAYRENYS